MIDQAVGAMGQHACIVVDGAAEGRRRIVEWLGSGLERGMRAALLGTGSPERLWGELDDLGPGPRARGDLTVIPLGPPPVAASREGRALVDTLAREARRAAADGRRGLRCAADATPLLAHGDGEDHLRYEWLLDGRAAREPLEALCLADRSLPPERLAEMACIHASAEDDVSPFRLFHAGGALVLEGTVDRFDGDRLLGALARASELHDGALPVVQAGALGFIDHRSLRDLDAWALAEGHRLALHGARPVVRRLASLVGPAALRVEGAV